MKHLPPVPTTTPLAALESIEDRGATVIDLRAPSEYAQDHLPGAVNVPLFDDAERALIGTLYRRASPASAFEEGRRAVSERIVELVNAVAELAGWTPPEGDWVRAVIEATEGGIEALEADLVARPAAGLPERPVVLHCWRGGLRSRSVVAFLRALGLDRAVGLEGGYRAWRRAVIDGLAAWSPPPTFVIRGLTGVGKTLVLRELERLRPGWTVDLEGLAGHRSSILGMVGLEPRTQKAFDSGLFTRLRKNIGAPVVFEGESRKVGDVILPATVWEALQAGHNVLLEAPVARRVEVLTEDYLARPESRSQLREQLPFIEQRLGPKKWRGALVELLDTGREAELVELLLEHYYDPLYRHSEKGREYELAIDSSDPAAAAGRVAEWVAQTLRSKSASPSRAWARSS